MDSKTEATKTKVLTQHYWVSPSRNETDDPCDLCGHYGWREVPGCECCDLTPAQRRQQKRALDKLSKA